MNPTNADELIQLDEYSSIWAKETKNKDEEFKNIFKEVLFADFLVSQESSKNNINHNI